MACVIPVEYYIILYLSYTYYGLSGWKDHVDGAGEIRNTGLEARTLRKVIFDNE